MAKSGDNEFLLGGQAVIEGVMMRSPNYYTVAVRRADGAIVLRRAHHPRLAEKIRWLGIPFLRGVAMLGQTLSIGINALNFSAEIAEAAETAGEKSSRKQSSGGMFAVVSFALLFAFGLVVFLPLLLTDLVVSVFPVVAQPLWYNTVDGLFRLAIFLAYIGGISIIPDIRRVFEYHGAEHMAVFAGEKDGAITVENARRHSPYHPRCGTSFLMLVMLISIAVFSLTPTREPFWIKLLIRTPLIPVIAGVSYEVLRLSARFADSFLFRLLSAPGLWLQRLTARRPDDDQLAVAVLALNQVVELETGLRGGAIAQEDREVVIPAVP